MTFDILGEIDNLAAFSTAAPNFLHLDNEERELYYSLVREVGLLEQPETQYQTTSPPSNDDLLETNPLYFSIEDVDLNNRKDDNDTLCCQTEPSSTNSSKFTVFEESMKHNNISDHKLQPTQVKQSVVKVSLCTYYHREVGYLALHVDRNVILRRLSDGFINGTKLLQICGLSKGKIRQRLNSLSERVPMEGGHRYVTGTWIPLEIARAFAIEFDKKHIVWPLLHNNPRKHLNVTFITDKNIADKDTVF